MLRSIFLCSLSEVKKAYEEGFETSVENIQNLVKSNEDFMVSSVSLGYGSYHWDIHIRQIIQTRDVPQRLEIHKPLPDKEGSFDSFTPVLDSTIHLREIATAFANLVQSSISNYGESARQETARIVTQLQTDMDTRISPLEKAVLGNLDDLDLD